MRNLGNAVVTMLLSVTIVAPLAKAQEPAWRLSLEVPSGQYILMEPIWAHVSVTNVSSENVRRTGLFGRFYLDGSEVPCRSAKAPTFYTTIPSGDTSTPKTESLVGPGFVIAAWVDLAEECNLAAPEKAVPGHHIVCYRDDATVGLITRSACASFDIVLPTGVDKQAYEAFNHDPLGNHDRLGELLRRFPTSTYAAYVVWKRWGKVTAGAWKSAEDRDKFLAWLAEDPDQGYLTWNLPCAEDGRRDGAVTRRLGGRLALACRDRWLDLVLDQHPNIWFADEVRLRLALNRYRLGDKYASVVGLEELAEHGRPDISAKAKALLAAMKAKGMLPEEGEKE